ncbi:MAG: hypothetical protein GY806_10630 [Gammaproteobacteria bacterium]|nr:hypothetical protein [Gammaproteobacteria bacterium]
MRLIILSLLFWPIFTQAANFKVANSIACVSDQSSILGKHRNTESANQADEAKSRFSEWLFSETFGDGRSKLRFNWTPVGEKGPSIEIITNEKPHNLLKIRSHTRNSLIFVTSASNPFSTESWTFALNFKVETLVATRVQSNIASVRGEIITYNCQFEDLHTTGNNRSDDIS